MIAIAGHTPGSIALLYRDDKGHPHLVHRRLAVPGRRGQHLRRQGRRSPSSSTRCRSKIFDSDCPTRPGSTRATAATPRSAPSAALPRVARRRGWCSAESASAPLGAQISPRLPGGPGSSGGGRRAERQVDPRPAVARPMPAHPGDWSVGGRGGPRDRWARVEDRRQVGRTGSGRRRWWRTAGERPGSPTRTASKLELVGQGTTVCRSRISWSGSQLLGGGRRLSPAKTDIEAQSRRCAGIEVSAGGVDRRPRRRAPAPACRRSKRSIQHHLVRGG